MTASASASVPTRGARWWRAVLLALGCGLAGSAARAQTALPPPVSWSASQQRASGLRVEHEPVGSYRRTRQAIAEVLDPARLLQAQAALEQALARRTQAGAQLRLAASRARQAGALYAAGQDVARATLDQAQAAQLQAQARLEAAQGEVRAARAAATGVLGPALERGLRGQPGLLGQLARGRRLVLRVVLPPGRRLPDGARLSVLLPGAPAASAAELPLRLLGPAPHAGELSQGLAYLALAPARDELQPGLRVPAAVASATTRRGVWVPASAVLFHGGRAFVFEAARPSARGDRQFTARVVSTAWPLQGGYVQPGWSALDVVSGGAGLLLTPPPEAHTLPPAGDNDDGDDD